MLKVVKSIAQILQAKIDPKSAYFPENYKQIKSSKQLQYQVKYLKLYLLISLFNLKFKLRLFDIYSIFNRWQASLKIAIH